MRCQGDPARWRPPTASVGPQCLLYWAKDWSLTIDGLKDKEASDMCAPDARLQGQTRGWTRPRAIGQRRAALATVYGEFFAQNQLESPGCWQSAWRFGVQTGINLPQPRTARASNLRIPAPAAAGRNSSTLRALGGGSRNCPRAYPVLETSTGFFVVSRQPDDRKTDARWGDEPKNNLDDMILVGFQA
jgi:hypothetical protein